MLINPYFICKDARDLDQLMEDVSMYKNNGNTRDIHIGHMSNK